MKKTQIKALTDLVSLVNVRNHLLQLANGPRTGLISRDEEKKLREVISMLDREVVEESLNALKEEKDVPVKKTAKGKPSSRESARSKPASDEKSKTQSLVRRVDE